MIESKSVFEVKVEKQSYSVCCAKDGEAFETFALAVHFLKLEKISKRRSQKCYVCAYYLVTGSPQIVKNIYFGVHKNVLQDVTAN
jgi:hypothetical protein